MKFDLISLAIGAVAAYFFVTMVAKPKSEPDKWRFDLNPTSLVGAGLTSSDNGPARNNVNTAS